MIFINNRKQKLFKIKLKDNTGSAMSLVIVVMSLLLIFAPYMTSQIANQFRSTRNSYEDIQVKYLAEAGIERSIAEIEKQVKLNPTKTDVVEYSNTNHHQNDDCPKVEFNENGVPTIKGNSNSFYDLIGTSFIDGNGVINTSYNILLHPDWKNYFHKDLDLRAYYQDNVRSSIQIMYNFHQWQTEEIKLQLKKIESNINEFIKLLNKAIDRVNEYKWGDKETEKKQAIDGYNKMIGYMNEIKCRLNMGSISGVEETIENKEIEVPYYDVTIDDNDNLTFSKNSTKTKKCQITIKKQNGKTTSIDFTNINNNLIGAKANNYEISADIDFAYLNKFNTIEQSVNSYNRVN